MPINRTLGHISTLFTRATYMLFFPVYWAGQQPLLSTCILKQKMASPAKKKKHSRSFRSQSLKHPAFKDWLLKDYDEKDSSIRMKCLICSETKQKNIFTTGCTDFQRSSIVWQFPSDGHQCAMQIKSAKGSIKKAFSFSHTIFKGLLTHANRLLIFRILWTAVW